MASLVLSGDTSGSITLSSPAVSGSTTQTLVAVTGTLAPVVSGTSQASTSGTSIDFTSIPSWVKRITVMFDVVSTNGTSPIIVQIGDSGGIENTGYGCAIAFTGPTAGSGSGSTVGFPFSNNAAASTITGHMVITNLTSNTWVYTSAAVRTNDGYVFISGGSKSLSGTLDRVRITTVNGTDTFDAGTINILYE